MRQQNLLGSGAGVGSGRGSAVVAAAAMTTASGLSATPKACNDWVVGNLKSCGSTSDDTHQVNKCSGISHKKSSRPEAPGEDTLFVQCGKHALVVLTFQQLLALTGGQVADVADAPDATGHKAVQTGVGQQLDPHFSGGQQSAVSIQNM